MIGRNIVPISLLCAAVLIALLAFFHPDKFAALQPWQTLLGSFVALGAATVAYTAAMAKVAFDERTARENERRKALGIFLRLDFALDVFKYEAKEYLSATELPKDSSGNDTTDIGDIALSSLEEIKEAWQNLDYFPVELSRAFYDVQNDL